MAQKPTRGNHGIGRALLLILQENERMFKADKREKPKTDEDILMAMIRRFPNSTGIKSMVAGRNTVNEYRMRMNSGVYFPTDGPMWPPSFRYNADGKRVEFRYGKKVLTEIKQKEIIERCLKYLLTHANKNQYDLDPEKAREMAFVR